MLTYFASGEGQHLPDSLVHVDFGQLQPRSPGERHEPADDTPRTHGGPLHPHQALSDRLEIGIVAPEPDETGSRLHGDRAEGLVDLMDNGSDQLPQRGQPRDECEIYLRVGRVRSDIEIRSRPRIV